MSSDRRVVPSGSTEQAGDQMSNAAKTPTEPWNFPVYYDDDHDGYLQMMAIELIQARAKLARVAELADAPDLAEGYSNSAIVVDATALSNALYMDS